MPRGTASSRMILVPRDTPGVRIVRPLTVFGYDDRDHGGHAEIAFDDVRVPAANLIGGEGDGLRDRAGPARARAASTTACARSGMAERALVARARARDAARTRSAARSPSRASCASGSPSPASSSRRCGCSCSRPPGSWTPSATAQAMTEIQAIKIAVPRAVQQILDRAIQVFGAAGLSGRQPLAEMFAGVRSLRLADGPDEVHLNALGKAEFGR